MSHKYHEATISSKPIFDGKVIKVKVDTVELPNGKHATRELVLHPGAVGILAISNENKIVLVNQFRKPLEKMNLEIPAGKLELNEDPRECAIRELKEETGYSALNMTPFTKFYTSPGFANEIIYLFQAEDLEIGEANPDEDEFVDLVTLTLEESLQLIDAGEIVDGKTIIAIYYWQIQSLKDK